MPLQVHLAKTEDVERIAAIHLAAFDSNPLLHVQFPSPSSLKALKDILSRDMAQAVNQGESTGKVVIVARDSEENDEIIAFAKWDLPGLSKDTEVHPEVVWPPDCRVEYLDRYHSLAEAMKLKVIGDMECYRMTFVGTDPKYQGRGAATLLTNWGLERAARDAIPVYLESTLPAVSLYQRLGFVGCDRLSLDLPGSDAGGSPNNVYEEVGMLRRW